MVAVLSAAVPTAVILAANRSPKLVCRLVKVLFERDGARVAARMQAHVPAGVTSRLDISYRAGDADALLDIHRNPGVTGPLPVLLWVHGGAWVSGSKEDVAPYLKIIAMNTPCAAVGINYSIGPGSTYPTAVRQLNDAFRYLNEHCSKLEIDVDKVVLAGDSAGAQLASQYAAMVTNPGYAEAVGIEPVLTDRQLRGVILQCGVFDLARLDQLTGLLGWAYDKIIWAYTGARKHPENKAARQMSTISAVTERFPTTLISGGPADPLTSFQSVPFAAALAAVAVPMQAHFYPADHQPALGHEYQFDLDGADGSAMLATTLAFLAERFSTPYDDAQDLRGAAM